MIHHKQLNKWLTIGGHIELDEDPEQALFREIQEECGLEAELIGEKPNLTNEDRKSLIPPDFLDIHKISDTHRHVAFIYYAKSKDDKVKLNKEEHNEIRWFTKEDLENPSFNVPWDIKYYCLEALKKIKC